MLHSIASGRDRMDVFSAARSGRAPAPRVIALKESDNPRLEGCLPCGLLALAGGLGCGNCGTCPCRGACKRASVSGLSGDALLEKKELESIVSLTRAALDKIRTGVYGFTRSAPHITDARSIAYSIASLGFSGPQAMASAKQLSGAIFQLADYAMTLYNIDADAKREVNAKIQAIEYVVASTYIRADEQVPTSVPVNLERPPANASSGLLAAFEAAKKAAAASAISWTQSVKTEESKAQAAMCDFSRVLTREDTMDQFIARCGPTGLTGTQMAIAAAAILGGFAYFSRRR